MINSNERLSYKEAQFIIDNNTRTIPAEISLNNKKKEINKEVEGAIYIINKIAKKLREERHAKGSISFNKKEVKFVLNKDKEPVKTIIKESLDANKLIEEFMLLANKKVANLFVKHKKGLFRIHDYPDDQKIITLERIIKSHPDLVLVTSFRNAIEAKNGINNRFVDLVFLDIEMPLISGFELLETLKYKPQVIVVSGNTAHALKAFEYDVTDFLQKPILLTRFDLAIKRAMLKYEQIHQNDDSENQIFIRSKMSKKRINFGEIKWIEAKGDYVKIVTLDSHVIVLSSLRAFHELLPQETFIRVHKSFVINIEKIDRFNAREVAISGQVIPVSRAKKSCLSEAMKFI